MRNFIISLICIMFVFSAWLGFSSFSSYCSQQCISHAGKLISVYISSEDWDGASSQMDLLMESWDDYKKVAYFFLDAREINEIESALNKTSLYIEAHDISNSNGEISYLTEKIRYLHQSDLLLLHNIF